MIPVEEEVQKLVQEIKRLGSVGKDGKICVEFGILVRDDRIAQIFEAVVMTLKAAKKRKVIGYESEILLQGVSDKVLISLLSA